MQYDKCDLEYIDVSKTTTEVLKGIGIKWAYGTYFLPSLYICFSVKGDYGEDIHSFFQYAILPDVPRDIRLQRVKERSFQKFGSRMLSGGDLFEQEEKFSAL